jgi:predicted nuclease of restriction endonuclease-like RecB superfamily
MSTLSDYRMHARTCPLFNDPEAASAAIEIFVTYEKDVSRAKRNLNASLKKLFEKYDNQQVKRK